MKGKQMLIADCVGNGFPRYSFLCILRIICMQFLWPMFLLKRRQLEKLHGKSGYLLSGGWDSNSSQKALSCCWSRTNHKSWYLFSNVWKRLSPVTLCFQLLFIWKVNMWLWICNGSLLWQKEDMGRSWKVCSPVSFTSYIITMCML